MFSPDLNNYTNNLFVQGFEHGGKLELYFNFEIFFLFFFPFSFFEYIELTHVIAARHGPDFYKIWGDDVSQCLHLNIHSDIH